MAKRVAPESFAAVVRAVREENGLTQPQMAAKLGVSRTTVRRWEGGELEPDHLTRHGVIVRVEKLGSDEASRVAASLKIEPRAPAGPATHGPPSPAIVKAALDGAVFEATEKLGATRARVTEALLLVLERMTLLGLDAKAAARLLGAK